MSTDKRWIKPGTRWTSDIRGDEFDFLPGLEWAINKGASPAPPRVGDWCAWVAFSDRLVVRRIENPAYYDLTTIKATVSPTRPDGTSHTAESVRALFEDIVVGPTPPEAEPERWEATLAEGTMTSWTRVCGKVEEATGRRCVRNDLHARGECGFVRNGAIWTFRRVGETAPTPKPEPAPKPDPYNPHGDTDADRLRDEVRIASEMARADAIARERRENLPRIDRGMPGTWLSPRREELVCRWPVNRQGNGSGGRS